MNTLTLLAKKHMFFLLKVLKTKKAQLVFESNLFIFIISALLGIVFFVFVYGVKILNPTYTDWLMVGGDPTIHYLGFEMFRNSDWHWPIGLSLGSVYPLKESIVYSDSIPLFAIFFKLLSPILPNNFQYFGLFGILTYALQGGISGLIIKKMTNNVILSIIGSLFFIMSSTLTWRIYVHTALSAHFIILVSIYICITKDKNRSLLSNSLIWGLLLSLAASIHSYFVPMVFIPMLFYYVDDIIEYKKIKKTITEFIISIIALLMTMYLLGMFYSNYSKESGGFGTYSTNINSIINPAGLGISAFIKDLPVSTGGQYEGNAYIGFGMIILIFLAIFSSIDDYKFYLKRLSDRKVLRRVVFCVITFFTFYVLALSNVVGFNDKVLFTYPIPEFANKIMTIFRGSGRFIWPNVYLIMFLVIYISVRKYNKLTSVLILSILAFVQFQDMSSWFNRKGEYFRNEQVWASNLNSDIWEYIANDFQHLFYASDIDNRNPVLKFAADNNLTVNDTSLARKDHEAISQYKAEILSNLNNGIAQNDTVYFFSTNPIQLITDRKLFFYEFDGMIAGFNQEFSNWPNIHGVRYIDPNDGISVMPKDNINLGNAIDDERGRILKESGVTWTNYYDLSEGIYTYEWTGENFDNAAFDMSYGDGSQTLEITNIERTNTSFRFDVLVPKSDIKNLHARCFNRSNIDIVITSIKLYKN